MGRPSKKLHELVPIRKGTKAVVNYGGRSGVYLGPWDAEKDEPSAEAVRRLAELVARWRLGGVAGPRAGGLTVLGLWRRWRESPEGRTRDAATAGRLSRFLFGTAAAPGPHASTPATAFGSPELREWQAGLCAATNAGGGKRLARETVRKVVRMLRACFAWGVLERIVTHDQYRELELVPGPADGQAKPDGRRKGVAWEAVAAVLPRLSRPMAAYIRLLWYTCARPGELRFLRCGEVRTGGKLLAASGVVLDLKKLGVWAAVKEEHKTDGGGYDRIIFFGPKSQRVLRPLLRGRPAGAAILRPRDAGAGAGHGGERYSETAVLEAVKRACRRLGVPRWTPYQIRHSAFRLVQQRFGRDAARVFGGHKVGGVTERYAGSDLNAAAKVAAKWG